MSVTANAPRTGATTSRSGHSDAPRTHGLRRRPSAEPLERRWLLAVSNVATFDVFGTESNPTEATPLLTFRDTDPDGTFGPYTARITWGDTSVSDGAVAAVTTPGAPPGTFHVSGSHVYGDEGVYPVRVVVSDASGVLTSADVTARVADALVMQPRVGYPAPSGIVALGDFNGDGIRDVVTADPNENGLRVLEGDGDGTFRAARLIATTQGPRVRSIAVADFNRDGRSDIAAGVGAGAGIAEGVEVFLARSDGAFVPAVGFDAPAGSLLTADLNNDNRADLLAGSPTVAGFVVALGIGNGAFLRSSVPGSAATSVATADFDGDGKLDLAASSQVQGQTRLSILAGRGDGTFGAPVHYTLASSPQAVPAFVAAGDVDGDGRADVVAAAPMRNTLYFLSNAGNGTLRPGAAYPLDASLPIGSTGAGTAGIGAANDVNRDGILDLVRADTVRRTLNVRLGQGRNAFRPFASDVRLAADPESLGVVVGDLNGDGRADILTGSAAGDVVSVFLATPLAAAGAADAVAVEGVPATGLLVATFAHEDPAQATASDFAVTIDWGDGTTSPGAVTPDGSGGFRVTGSHTYAEPGAYAARTTILGPRGIRSVVTAPVAVTNAPFTVAAADVVAGAGAEVTAVVATMVDTNPSSEPGDFRGRIEWGDGTVSDAVFRQDGTAAGGGRAYTLFGTHAYTAQGRYPVRVTATDVGAGAASGGGVTASGTATAAAPGQGGGTVSGMLFNDYNSDGVRQSGEPGMFGWTVFLDADGDGQADPGERTAVTSAAGSYTLFDVPGGDWTVRSATRPGWSQTAPTGAGAPVTLAPGQSRSGVDLGLHGPPVVTGAWINGRGWSQSFRDSLQSAGLGDANAGFALAPLWRDAPLPWNGVDQVSIRFSEPVVVEEADLRVVGTAGGAYAFSLFQYEPATRTATWTIAPPPHSDKLGIELSGVNDTAGEAVDGDPPPTGSWPTGDGEAGGPLRLRLDLLPGDVNRDGRVDARDVAEVRSRLATSPRPARAPNGYGVFHDVNASGGSSGVNVQDLVAVRRQTGSVLPAGEPAAPAPTAAIAAARTSFSSRRLPYRGERVSAWVLD